MLPITLPASTPREIRTPDTQLRRLLFCPLNYRGKAGEIGFEPMTKELTVPCAAAALHPIKALFYGWVWSFPTLNGFRPSWRIGILSAAK